MSAVARIDPDRLLAFATKVKARNRRESKLPF
jgi:hypothetical protein